MHFAFTDYPTTLNYNLEHIAEMLFLVLYWLPSHLKMSEKAIISLALLVVYLNSMLSSLKHFYKGIPFGTLSFLSNGRLCEEAGHRFCGHILNVNWL